MWEDIALFFAMGFFYASLIPMVFSACAKKLHLHPVTIIISIIAEFLFLISFISFGLAISVFITAMAFFMWVIIGILYIRRETLHESIHN